MSSVIHREMGNFPLKRENSTRDLEDRFSQTSLSKSALHLPKDNFHVIQALRAIAALLVLVYHINHSIFGQEKYWSTRPFGLFFEFGHAGVEFFFVLSGFIIYMAHRQDIGINTRFKSFAWKRFRRVYPVYWVMLAIVVPIFFIFPTVGGGFERNPLVIADSISLFHLLGDSGEVLTVSWTLFHEVMFYLVFSLLILSRPIGMAAIGLWMAVSCFGLVVGSSIRADLQFYVSPLHLLFGMGMFAAWLITTRRVAYSPVLLVIGVSVFLGTGIDEVYGHYLTPSVLSLLYGVGSMIILVSSVQLERSGKLRVPKIFVVLGNASYSIYLVHFVALSVLAKIAIKFIGDGAPITLAGLFIAFSAGALVAGVLFHFVVETPLLALLSRPKPTRASAVAQ